MTVVYPTRAHAVRKYNRLNGIQGSKVRYHDEESAPRKVLEFLKKIISSDLPSNDFYRALTKEHWDDLIPFLHCKSNFGDAGRDLCYCFEAFSLDSNDADTWPAFDTLLPEELHPDSIDASKYFGKKPIRGAYVLGGNGVPRSYAKDESVSTGVGLKIIGDGLNALAAGKGHGVPQSIAVNVTNELMKRKATTHFPVTKDLSLYDAIYDSEVLARAKVRSFPKETIDEFRSGTKQMVCCVWDTEKDCQFARYTKEDMKERSILDVFEVLPKDGSSNQAQIGFLPLQLILKSEEGINYDTDNEAEE